MQEFDGNSDRNTTKSTKFGASVRARYFKIQPLQWEGAKPSMRFDLLAEKWGVSENPIVCVLIEGGKRNEPIFFLMIYFGKH